MHHAGLWFGFGHRTLGLESGFYNFFFIIIHSYRLTKSLILKSKNVSWFMYFSVFPVT